jgi:hypothetical protein
MNKNKRPKRIKKDDYFRVLATETLPYETPIIFSNEGLYTNSKNYAAAELVQRTLMRGLVTGEALSRVNATIPFSYKIKKNSLEFRRLSLLHPLSQWRMKGFYQEYENLLLHLCAGSPASIRAPHKIAGTFYIKNSWENINQYKNGSVSEVGMDGFTKYSPSYFSYRGFDRLYKFFDSKDFFNMEKTYSHLWTLDVSKCFDSIYTHCLSWAVKDKEFTKKHLGVDSTFSQSFDALMRHANHNETNGIVIGPEISRIFAEIIFQAIDARALLKLQDQYKLVLNQDYAIRRYVDDVFIFARDEGKAKTVYECYADTLGHFNLHANSSKSVRMVRPFLTKKSRVTRDASAAANEFVEKFMEEVDGTARLVPRKIHYNWRLSRSFINAVKSICSYNDANYDDVSSYLISIFTERVKKLANVTIDSSDGEVSENYRDSALVLLEVLFFLYSVSPSVSASYKLCTSIIVLIRFSEKNINIYAETIKQKIYELTMSLLSTDSLRQAVAVDGFISLEAVNVVLASRELGENYLLPEATVNKLFQKDGSFSYFDIICCLFYVRKNDAYANVRRSVMRAADSKLRDLSDIFSNTEKACLFLDLLACPYIYEAQKRSWISRFFSQLSIAQPTLAEMSTFLSHSADNHWFVNWTEVDLLNALEKKELKRAY